MPAVQRLLTGPKRQYAIVEINGDHEILPFDVVIDFPNERINCPLEALTTTHGGILFSSSHLLVSGVSASVFVGAYRERPHLCPLCRQRRH